MLLMLLALEVNCGGPVRFEGLSATLRGDFDADTMVPLFQPFIML
jgi:hypothetical protein